MTESEYAGHPLRSNVNQIATLMVGESFTDPVIATSEAYAMARDKVAAFNKVLGRNLNETPAVLVSDHGFLQLAANYQSVLASIVAFSQDRNPTHLINACASLEQNVIPYLYAFAGSGPRTDGQSVVDTMKALRVFSEQSLEKINTEKEGYLKQLAEQSEIVVGLQAKLEAMSDTITSQKAEALATNAQLNHQFAGQEAERSAAFTAALKDFEASKQAKDAQTESILLTAMDTLRAKQEEAARIVEAIGEIGTAGNYTKMAVLEGRAANLWRGITFVLFAVGMILAIGAWYHLIDGKITPELAWTAIVRMLLAIAITSPAWYTAKESARHRTNADRARQTELELASLGPYIELMPPQKKLEIRELLIPKYFGGMTNPHEVDAPGTIRDMTAFVEAMKAAAK